MAQDSLYLKTPVTPEEAFQAIGRLRKEARDEIDRLIRFLDETDNHMEREPDGDELDGSYPESGLRIFAALNEDDEDDDPGEDDGTGEPSLGAPERPSCSEGRRDGRNPTGDQTAWAAGSRDDREDSADDNPQDDPSESGIGDLDGLLEQVGSQDWQAGRIGMI